jgi:hypothetical protein
MRMVRARMPEDAVEPMIKGYIIQNSGRFILGDPVISKRVDEAIVEDIHRNEPLLKPTAWYPRRDVVKLWSAIAATQPDDASAYDALTRCGTFAGTQATTTFLKLLFKVLTPRMFASKFPDFYARDHQGGGEGVVEEIGQNRVVLQARDVEGYDHFGPNTVGWAGVGLRAMGLKNLKLTCDPWSLAEPGPKTIRFVATWD